MGGEVINRGDNSNRPNIGGTCRHGGAWDIVGSGKSAGRWDIFGETKSVDWQNLFREITSVDGWDMVARGKASNWGGSEDS